MKRPAPLPPLPFGDHKAVVETNLQAYSDRVAQVVSSLEWYDPIGGSAGFASKSAVLELGGMRLVAGSNTPLNASIGDNADTTLMVPFRGNNLSHVGQSNYQWNAGQSALLMPALGRGGVCTARATLNISLDPARMQATAQSMLGDSDHRTIDLRTADPRTVALTSHGIAFDATFRHLCGLIDSLDGNAQALALLGLDDALYRTIVTMLRPELFLGVAPTNAAKRLSTPQARRSIDPVCEYLTAHLGERTTLTEMERLSGLSARALQYAFQQRFGCSPLQWLRAARLDRAFQRIRQAEGPLNLTHLAMEVGYAKPSDFAQHYRQRFGELPSATRKKRTRL